MPTTYANTASRRKGKNQVTRNHYTPLMSEKQWLEAIRNRTARVGIIGMGYVGLPLMRTFCSADFSCLGFDIDKTKVERLNAGKSYIKHIPSSLIKQVRTEGRFKASCDPKSLR